MDRLLSKIFAGGLSAGVFLIWWPQHVQAEDLEHLVLRGLLWTLTFELLLLAFGPLENRAAARVRVRVDARRAGVTQRLEHVPAPARAGGAVALACLGLTGPLVLLAGAPHEIARKVDPQPRVVKQVIVQRPVIEKRIVVRRVVGPAAADAGAATALRSSGAGPSAPRAARARGHERPAASTTSARTTKRAATTPSKPPATGPATGPAPDAPATTTAPSDAAAAAPTPAPPQAAPATAPAP
jgi:hypothetical protein